MSLKNREFTKTYNQKERQRSNVEVPSREPVYLPPAVTLSPRKRVGKTTLDDDTVSKAEEPNSLFSTCAGGGKAKKRFPSPSGNEGKSIMEGRSIREVIFSRGGEGQLSYI